MRGGALGEACHVRPRSPRGAGCTGAHEGEQRAGRVPPRAAQTRAACSQPPRRTSFLHELRGLTSRDGTGLKTRPARHGPTAPGPHLQHRAGRAPPSPGLSPRGHFREERRPRRPSHTGRGPAPRSGGAAPAQPRACAPASRNAEEAPSTRQRPQRVRPRQRSHSPRPLPSPAQAAAARPGSGNGSEREADRAREAKPLRTPNSHPTPSRGRPEPGGRPRAREGKLGRQGPAGLPGRRPGSRGHGEPERRQQGWRPPGPGPGHPPAAPLRPAPVHPVGAGLRRGPEGEAPSRVPGAPRRSCFLLLPPLL